MFFLRFSIDTIGDRSVHEHRSTLARCDRQAVLSPCLLLVCSFTWSYLVSVIYLSPIGGTDLMRALPCTLARPFADATRKATGATVQRRLYAARAHCTYITPSA